MLPAIFALLVAAIGWYYLFYSQAAQRLGGIEAAPSNHLRGLLRRINAIITLLLALGIAIGSYKIDPHRDPTSFVLLWAAVLVLLLVFVLLALIDLRLTWKLRHTLRKRNRS